MKILLEIDEGLILEFNTQVEWDRDEWEIIDSFDVTLRSEVDETEHNDCGKLNKFLYDHYTHEIHAYIDEVAKNKREPESNKRLYRR